MNSLVSNIVRNSEVSTLLQRYKLKASHVTWEDCARNKNSCFGPNISDMTLVVKNGTLMPVIRRPNFEDVTFDIKIDDFKVRVGNENSESCSAIISFKDYIKNISRYLPNQTENVDLLRDRDELVLTSTQCCILPVQKSTKTEFAVQLFNYQSYTNFPAVLVVLATKNGTSAQILDNSNQKLLFNDKGDAKWLFAERLEDVRERAGAEKTKVDSFREMKTEEKLDNTIMVFQIPLKVESRTRGGVVPYYDSYYSNSSTTLEYEYEYAAPSCAPSSALSCSANTPKKRGLERDCKGMDMGQLGLGSTEGRYLGTKNSKLVRDDRFPIRCTFQYYRVTDTDTITEAQISDIAEQLFQVEKVCVNSGSLVTNLVDNSDTKNLRKTEPNLSDKQPSDFPYFKPNVDWHGNVMCTF